MASSSTLELNPVAELRHLLFQGLIGTVLESKDVIIIGGRSWNKNTRIDLRSGASVQSRDGISENTGSFCSLKQLFDLAKLMSEFPTSDHRNIIQSLGLDDSNDTYDAPPAKRARIETSKKGEKSAAPTVKISNIFELPSEMILKILSYLDQKERLIDASLICKRFRDLASDKLLWTELTFPRRRNNIKLDVVNDNLFERFTLLKHLTLCERTDTVVLAINALRACSGLETLKIDISEKENNKLKKLLDVIKDAKSLKSLKLVANVYTRQLAVRAKCLENLERIHIRFVQYDTNGDDDGDLLKALASNCINIKHLELFAHADTECLAIFLDSLTPQIEYFSLVHTCFSSISICKFNKFKYLQTLKLWGKHLDGNGLGTITKMTNLKTLELTDCSSLTDEHVLESFHRMDTLRSLSFGCEALGDPGLKTIVNNCPGLKTLTLQECNNVKKTGVQWVLKQCRMLENLNVLKLKLLVKPVMFKDLIAPLNSLYMRPKKMDVKTIKHFVHTLKMLNGHTC